MSDLLATQREIASTIAEKLQLKLAGNDTKGITKRYTDSNEAYQLYLKGRYYFGKRTKEGIDRRQRPRPSKRCRSIRRWRKLTPRWRIR